MEFIYRGGGYPTIVKNLWGGGYPTIVKIFMGGGTLL